MVLHRVEGSIFTVMVMEVGDPYDSSIETALAEQVGRNPGFFADAPIVIDLKSSIGGLAEADFAALKELFRRHGLVVVGVQNASRLQQRAALAADLAVFPGNGRRTEARGERPATLGPTKLVTHPVRSGTQIYAKGGDLIVTAPVSAGAELVADGHVHVYGALRGRAIAGARGNTDARIFVQRLEAELLAIAGRYLVSESIAPEFLTRQVQIALDGERISITPA
jgi:septum site-determining protein MinC